MAVPIHQQFCPLFRSPFALEWRGRTDHSLCSPADYSLRSFFIPTFVRYGEFDRGFPLLFCFASRPEQVLYLNSGATDVEMSAE